MPVTKNASAGGHRARKPGNILHVDACVARPVTKDEQKRADSKRRLKHDECKKTEWDRLTTGKVWKYDTIADVREWNDVAEQFRKSGKTVHLGRLFGIMVEKGSELPEDDSRRKFKYRVVFQGNNVTTQN